MPENDAMARQDYRLIKDVFLLLDSGDHRRLKAFGLSVPRYYALQHLAEHSVLTPSQLGAKLLCDKANVTRLLAGLETDGLIVRAPSAVDGRRTEVRLTPAGRRVWRQARQAHDAYIDTRLNGLPSAELRALYATLLRLKASLLAEQDSA